MCFKFVRYFSGHLTDKYYTMLINEILTEAISLTQYESKVQGLIIKGLQKALKRLSKTKGKFPEEEQELTQNDRSYPFRTQMVNLFTKYLATDIAKEFKNLKTIDGVQVDTIKFIKSEYGGYAQGTDLYIGSIIIKNIARTTIDTIDQFCIDASGEYPDRVITFFTMCAIIADGVDRHSKFLLNEILDQIQSGVDSIINTLTHELVHTSQHGRQFQKGRSNLEYRSYLDKKKGEFISLHNNKDWNKNPRARELYYASPQEIPAFAHEIALYIIRAYALPEITSVEEISTVTPEDITYAMSRYPMIASLATNPDPRAKKVYQRYAKLVYLEVQNYIQQLKQKLTKEAVPAT